MMGTRFALHGLLLSALALVALAPTAAADDIAYVAWVPGDIVLEDADEYYLKVTVSTPEIPRRGPADANDCSYDDRPTQIGQSAERLVDRLDNAANGPTPFSTWFPTCVGVPLGDHAYASYDIAEGRYYVESSYLGGIPLGGTSDAGVDVTNESGFTGTTGAGIEADCLACPQPP